MAGISFPGIGSGIDGAAVAKSLFDQLTLSNQVRKNNIDSRTRENSSLGQLRTLLLDLAGKLEGARSSVGGAGGKKVGSSNTDLVSAAASNSAALGSFNVTVSSLAKAGSGSFARTFSSANSFVLSNGAPGGKVGVTIGNGADATSFEVSVDESTTAQGFIESFNAAAGGKATASLVNVGTSGSPSYKISFSAATTGTDKGSIAITSDSPSVLGADGLGAATISQASNAIFSVSGVEGAIERSTNTVSDVLTGVTLTLKATGSVSLDVSNDVGAVKGQVKGFVESFNALAKFAAREDKITTTFEDGEVVNNYGSLVQSNVDDNALSAVRSALFGAASANGSTSLASVGVSTNRDGTLAFDEAKFDQAFAANSTGVTEAVTNLADRLTSVQGVVYQFTGFNLTIDQAINTNNREIDNLRKKIADVERYAARRQESVLKQFTNLERLIAKLNSDSDFLGKVFRF